MLKKLFSVLSLLLLTGAFALAQHKVSGKVTTIEKLTAMFEAGAELVGTSSGPAIVDGLAGDPNAY